MKYVIVDIDGTLADSSHRNHKLPAYTGKSIIAAIDRAEVKAGMNGTVFARHEKEGFDSTIVSVRWTAIEGFPLIEPIEKHYLWNDFMEVTGQDFIAWHQGMEDDKPIFMTLYALKAMRAQLLADNIGAFFLTSRWESFAPDTKSWLVDHGATCAGYPDAYAFRPDGNNQKDTVMKGAILDRMEAEGHEFVFAFDDRKAVADYLRGRGIPCFHVADYS